MKKLLLTTIVVLSMSWASFAGNGLVAPSSRNGNDTESIEKAKPHTQQYQDFKKILDEYEQDVKNAKTCEDLDDAAMSMLLKLFSLAENEYEEEVTPEEDKELTNQMERIDKKVTELQKQWGCETEEEAEPTVELTPITTEEWEKILNDFDALTNKLEGMKDMDFDDEENLGVMLEFIMEAQPLMERMENSDPETLTDSQRNRLEKINDRFNKAAEKIDLD